MKVKSVSTLFILCVIALVVLVSASRDAYSAKVRGVTDNLIKVGVIIDLTGPISNVGVIMVEAYKNLINAVNDEGGIHGRKIKLIIEDDRYSIPAGIAAFKKLVFKDQALALLGPVSVGEAKVLFRHVAKQKIPMLPWAPDRAMMEPYKRYVFPTNGFYENEWAVIFDYIMNEQKPSDPKMAICCPDVESGKVVRRLAEEWAASYGLKLHREIIPLSALDVTSQVLGMRRARVTHILVHHVAPGAAAVLRDMKKFGLKVPVYGTSACTTEDIMRISGKATDNFIGASPYSSWSDDSPGMERVRDISMKQNPDAIKTYKLKSYILGWVVPEILFEGIRRAGKDVDGEKLVAALETIKDFDTSGLCGPITYTPEMHYGLNYNKLFKTNTQDGTLVPITDWRLPPSKQN